LLESTVLLKASPPRPAPTALPVASFPLKIATVLVGIVCGIAPAAESGASEDAAGATKDAELVGSTESDGGTDRGTKTDASGARSDVPAFPGAGSEEASATFALASLPARLRLGGLLPSFAIGESGANGKAVAGFADVLATAEFVEEGDAGTAGAESGTAEERAAGKRSAAERSAAEGSAAEGSAAERAAEDGNTEAGSGAGDNTVMVATAPDAPAEVAEGEGASGGARGASGMREDTGAAAATRTSRGSGTGRTIFAVRLARFGASWGVGPVE